MKKIQVEKLLAAYRKYSGDSEKKALNARIIENNRWYKQQYTEYESSENRTRPAGAPQYKSGYIFSAIAGKHADAMDNYPDVNVLPREENDVDTARQLTEILPCVLELCEFKRTYSQNWWYKLKNGTACYGVFWNSSLNGGLGDIEIKKIDLLNLCWQPGISDIQDSKYVFYSYYMDRDAFAKAYGKDKLPKAADIYDVDSYHDKTYTLAEDSVLVIDGYYKKDGAMHLVKFTGDTVLEQTEGRPEYANGLYEHGKYPFVLDVMYPNEDSPAGFGVIDVVKNPQAYIDKLDALLAENSMIVGKTRYFIKDNGGVNEDEFADLSNPFVHVAGSLDERNIMQIQGQPLPAQIRNLREAKINELKEVIGNRDFQQGGTSGGVTAASAITVLQQAGDKLSRDLIGESYMAYKRIVELCIELMRQFYDVERSFRILGDGGEQRFVKFDNAGLRESLMNASQGRSMNLGGGVSGATADDEDVGKFKPEATNAPVTLNRSGGGVGLKEQAMGMMGDGVQSPASKQRFGGYDGGHPQAPGFEAAQGALYSFSPLRKGTEKKIRGEFRFSPLNPSHRPLRGAARVLSESEPEATDEVRNRRPRSGAEWGQKPEALASATEQDGWILQADGYFRKPEFDVSLSIQKSNPFTKEQQNQTIMQLWGAGFFNPQATEMSTIALEFMQFEGKDELLNKLQEFGQAWKTRQAQAQGGSHSTDNQAAMAGQQEAQTDMQGGGQLVEIPLNGMM